MNRWQTFMKQFLGQTQAPNPSAIQPNLADVKRPNVLLGDVTPGLVGAFDDDLILTTGMVGATDPDAFINVTSWGVPPAPVAILNGGAPLIAATNAPAEEVN